MEITRTFGATFQDMMRAKLRWFWRRSILRYAIGVALVTYGLHGLAESKSTGEILLRGVVYFLILCVVVLILHIFSAVIQSRRNHRRTVTFTAGDIIVTEGAEPVSKGWTWIDSAEETPEMFALMLQRMPRLELFLPKSKLSQAEYQAMRGWLISHKKLANVANDV